MSNTHLNISMIAKEALRIFKNELVFTKGANSQYSDEFAKKGAKIGNVINIRKPQRFTVSDGATLDLQNTEDKSVALTLDKRKHVAFQFSSSELALNVDDFGKKYLASAMTSLANQVDVDGLLMAKTHVYNSVGTPGTAPTTAAAAMELGLRAGQKMSEMATPMSDRSVILNPGSQVSMLSNLSSLFNSTEQLKKQYEKGIMGTAMGFDWKMAQNIPSYTTGLMGGTPAVKTTITAQGATTVLFDGASNSITGLLKAGDVITFGSVYAVNPITKASTGSLQQFVVQAAVDSDGSGEGSITILPGMYSDGAYKNVDALPVDGGLITLFGHASSYANKVTACNIAYHKDAFVLGTADLDLPGGVDKAARETDPESGLSIRVVRQYDINNDTWPCRIDVLYGWQALYPEMACRIHM